MMLMIVSNHMVLSCSNKWLIGDCGWNELVSIFDRLQYYFCGLYESELIELIDYRNLSRKTIKLRVFYLFIVSFERNNLYMII